MTPELVAQGLTATSDPKMIGIFILFLFVAFAFAGLIIKKVNH